MKRFKLRCIQWNNAHVGFNVFDHLGANCGRLVVRTQDALQFVSKNWNGDVFWDGKCPMIIEPKKGKQ